MTLVQASHHQIWPAGAVRKDGLTPAHPAFATARSPAGHTFSHERKAVRCDFFRYSVPLASSGRRADKATFNASANIFGDRQGGHVSVCAGIDVPGVGRGDD